MSDDKNILRNLTRIRADEVLNVFALYMGRVFLVLASRFDLTV